MDRTSENLCKLCSLLARHTNRAESTISRLATGSGDTIARLRDGKRITTTRAERALRALSNMWPDKKKWPADIERPAAKMEDAA